MRAESSWFGGCRIDVPRTYNLEAHTAPDDELDHVRITEIHREQGRQQTLHAGGFEMNMAPCALVSTGPGKRDGQFVVQR